MKNKLRESVRWFAGIMEEVMGKHGLNREVSRMNHACDDWGDDEWYFQRLKDKVKELTSIEKNFIVGRQWRKPSGEDGRNLFEVKLHLSRNHQLILEAADVANLAMMIAERAKIREAADAANFEMIIAERTKIHISRDGF